MPYTVNWITKVITIPIADMVSEGGADYSLDADSFWREIRRLEWEATEGLWAVPILEHTDPETLSGIPFATRNKVINGYTVTFDPAAEKVFLRGDVNNIADVFNYNGVSVIPTNVGSALTPGDQTKLTRVYDLLDTIEGGLDHAEVQRIILAAVAGKGGDNGSNEFRYRDLADTKDRITATTDGQGNRTSVVLNAD